MKSLAQLQIDLSYTRTLRKVAELRRQRGAVARYEARVARLERAVRKAESRHPTLVSRLKE